MGRLKPEKLRELEKYTKAEIIEAIERNYSAGYIVHDLLRDLKRIQLQKMLDDKREADRIYDEKLEELIAWRKEVVEKYGDGITVKLSVLPHEEARRGVNIEMEYKTAQKAVTQLEKRIKKHMEALNGSDHD